VAAAKGSVNHTVCGGIISFTDGMFMLDTWLKAVVNGSQQLVKLINIS
jgi:hypothetical protein